MRFNPPTDCLTDSLVLLSTSHRFPPTKWGTEEASNLACHHRFRACIESHSPDLIVSVHPLCQDVPLRVLNTIGHGR
jgi:1,2-diacylglycerol 3-beta-galactosyltransferase